MKVRYLQQAWLVLTLALMFGGGLSAVYLGLDDRIEQNKRDEAYRQIPELLDIRSGADYEVQPERIAGMTVFKVVPTGRAGAPHGRPIGWVVKASGIGFADQIEVLIGLGPAAQTIRGVGILAQTETPGLGDKISGPWNDQFAGTKATENLEVVKSGEAAGNEIQAISGATVSSQAVTDIVNRAVIRFRNARPWRRVARQRPGQSEE